MFFCGFWWSVGFDSFLVVCGLCGVWRFVFYMVFGNVLFCLFLVLLFKGFLWAVFFVVFGGLWCLVVFGGLWFFVVFTGRWF